MKVVVYDIAADSGGALVVLNNYYQRACQDSANDYLFVLSEPIFAETTNVRVARFPEVKKSWLHRMAFDMFKAKKILNSFGVEKIISLQNTIIPFVHQPQTVYFHNILSGRLCDLKFSLFRDPIMWVYRNLIGNYIIYSLKRADKIIVQTNWIADRCVQRCGISRSKICVEKQKRKDKVVLCNRRKVTGEAIFLYPASSASFKNHKIIECACKLLSSENIKGYKVLFTVDSEYFRKEKINPNSIGIECIGWQTEEKLNNLYLDSDCLLFPSKLETVGLPLLEAQAYGLKVFAADLEYAHETLCGYPATYFDPDDGIKLASLMLEVIRSKNGDSGNEHM